MKKGFSLTEILTTVVIMAVLAAIAIPNFAKTKEKKEADQAITYLRAIRLAEKMYFAKNQTYCLPAWSCPGSHVMDASAMNSALGTEIVNGKYTFFSTVSINGTIFSAMAKLDNNNADTLVLAQNGTFSGTGVCTKYISGGLPVSGG